MRPRIACVALTGVVMVASSLVGVRGSNDDSKLDKKVLDIVKQVGDLHKNAKSLHVEMSVVEERENRKLKSEGTYDIEQPNYIALRTNVQGKKDQGFRVLCDGKKLFFHSLTQKQFTEAEAPPDLRDMGMRLFVLGQARTGMLFVNVLAADPYEQLMDGVTACSYAGKEKLGDVEAHHLKFTQEEFDWEMWVAVEGKPFVLKMSSTGKGDGPKSSREETYRNWKLDAAPGKDIFAFAPPKDAKKVESLADEHGNNE